MKEYKVGEQVILEVQENLDCKKCFFYNNYKGYRATICSIIHNCKSYRRSDGKNVIFVEKGK